MVLSMDKRVTDLISTIEYVYNNLNDSEWNRLCTDLVTSLTKDEFNRLLADYSWKLYKGHEDYDNKRSKSSNIKVQYMSNLLGFWIHELDSGVVKELVELLPSDVLTKIDLTYPNGNEQDDEKETDSFHYPTNRQLDESSIENNEATPPFKLKTMKYNDGNIKIYFADDIGKNTICNVYRQRGVLKTDTYSGDFRSMEDIKNMLYRIPAVKDMYNRILSRQNKHTTINTLDESSTYVVDDKFKRVLDSYDKRNTLLDLINGMKYNWKSGVSFEQYINKKYESMFFDESINESVEGKNKRIYTFLHNILSLEVPTIIWQDLYMKASHSDRGKLHNLVKQKYDELFHGDKLPSISAEYYSIIETLTSSESNYQLLDFAVDVFSLLNEFYIRQLLTDYSEYDPREHISSFDYNQSPTKYDWGNNPTFKESNDLFENDLNEILRLSGLNEKGGPKKEKPEISGWVRDNHPDFFKNVRDIIREFPIYYKDWDGDSLGWYVTMNDGSNQFILTNNGHPYISNADEVRELMNSVINSSRDEFSSEYKRKLIDGYRWLLKRL